MIQRHARSASRSAGRVGRLLGIGSSVFAVVAALLVVSPETEPALAAGGPSNLLAASGTSVAWSADFVGALNPPSSRATWPAMIYNNSSYSAVPVGQTFLAQNINANSAIGTSDCTSRWRWVQILCDSPTTTDNLYFAAKTAADSDAGFTIDSVSSTEAYVVIDLGSAQTFNTLRVFQMFSDGKVTQASLYTISETGGTRPAFNDPGWQLAAQAPVGAGLPLDSSFNPLPFNTRSAKFIACPTVIPLGTKSSRYVQLRFKNSGEFGDPSWIEVGAAKLFNESGLEPGPSPSVTCAPEPPRNAVATAGDESATVSWTAGTGTATGWSLQQSANGGSSWSTATTSPATVPSASTSTTVTGLTNGTEYVFRVRALSTVENSPYTPASNAVTPSSAPAPTPPGPNPPGPAPTPSPETTPTPIATPTPNVPNLDPITGGQNPNLPVGGVPLGGSVLLVNGQPAPVSVKSNRVSNPTALDIDGPGFTMQLAGRTTNNRPLGLTSGGALILEQDRTAFTQGTGFQANSQVFLYLLSTPRFLGTVATDASGAFQGSVPLPMDIPAGRHTLQANGITTDGAVRSLSLGVQVQETSTRATVQRANTTVHFAALSPRLDAAAKESLDALVKGRKKSVTRILVNGFVQGSDTTANDRSLSLARARAAARYLKAQGVAGTVVTRAEGVAQESGAAGRKAVVTITYRR